MQVLRFLRNEKAEQFLFPAHKMFIWAAAPLKLFNMKMQLWTLLAWIWGREKISCDYFLPSYFNLSSGILILQLQFTIKWPNTHNMYLYNVCML